MVRNWGAIAGLAGFVAMVIAASAVAGQERFDRTRYNSTRSPRTASGPAVRNLPHARGREFRTLDDYLAYLRTYAAPMDRPWYREVRPGLYRLETGNLRDGTEPSVSTREELERRFGFRR